MAFEVLVAIHLQLEKRVVNIFTGTKYEGTLEGGAEVKANADFTGKTKFYSDDSGFMVFQVENLKDFLFGKYRT